MEEPDKSYHAKHRVTDSDIFDNKLIFGDNLLALKALEQEYAGKVKCVFIDPPFNTGGAFEHYDDGLEHSVWLDLMTRRLQLLRSLLCAEGAIVVNLDDSEMAYCKVVLDQIFGRSNYITTIVVEAATGSSFKAANMGPLDTVQYLLFYAKDKSEFLYKQQYVVREAVDLQHFSRFVENFDSDAEDWKFTSINDHILSQLGYLEGTVQARWNSIKKDLGEAAKEIVERKATQFAIENAYRVFETKTLQKPAKYLKQKIEESMTIEHPLRVPREKFDDLYLYRGRQIYFLKNSIGQVDGIEGTVIPITTLWNDIPTNNLQREGGVSFPSGKKPEALLRRIIEMITDEGDIVLDSFAGSGTTAAVAHKLKRRWITVEVGAHAETHIIPRLKTVVDGSDPAGITGIVNWQGGGGFRYYKVAPSLLEQDAWGRWVVNKDYNPEMLTEAICKLEGFTYAPSDTAFWQQGYSTESDFIYVTTQTLSLEQLQALSDDIGQDRTLLVCCSAFRCKADRFPNLTLKKIPKMVLSRCEWGHDDYSLNVENLPMQERELLPGQDDFFNGEGE